jgi:hypothetical protein
MGFFFDERWTERRQRELDEERKRRKEVLAVPPWSSERERERYFRIHCVGVVENDPCMCNKCRGGRFDEEEIETAKDELFDAYRRIEQHRAKLSAAATEMDGLIEEFPFLAELWKSFEEIGGISSADLERHLAGKVLRYGPTKRKRHLRIVSSREEKPFVIRRRPRDEDDAA